MRALRQLAIEAAIVLAILAVCGLLSWIDIRGIERAKGAKRRACGCEDSPSPCCHRPK